MKTLITHHKNLKDLGKEKNRLQGLKLGSVLLILVFALSSMTSFAQKEKFRKMDKSEIQKRKAEGRTVKGNVSFKKEGLAGASIYLKDTQMGDNTNYKGDFIFPVGLFTGDILVVEYLGFEKQEVEIGSETTFINIEMKETEESLDVVVLGKSGSKKLFKSKRKKKN